MRASSRQSGRSSRRNCSQKWKVTASGEGCGNTRYTQDTERKGNKERKKRMKSRRETEVKGNRKERRK
jgi:hypothetical protein